MSDIIENLIVSTTEYDVDSIPINKGVDIEALKQGDSSPMDIVVKIPASTSTRNWDYKDTAIKDIVKVVNEKTLNGFKGHQKAENISTEFPDIQTHWVGAKWDETEKAGFFRGIMDKSATQLKDWISNGRIKQVSIFGKPDLHEDENGKISVIGYDPMSIDWTPLDRQGMPTEIVQVGEMSSLFDSLDNTKSHGKIEKFHVKTHKPRIQGLIFGEYANTEGTIERLQEDLRNSIRNSFSDENSYTYIRSTYPDKCIFEYDSENSGIKLYQVSYSYINGIIDLGTPEEVEEKVSYILKKGDGEMTVKELLLESKAKILSGEMSVEELKDIIKLDGKSDLIDKTIKKALGEMTAEEITAAKQLIIDNKNSAIKATTEKNIKTVIGEMITGKEAQEYITEIFTTQETDVDKIKAEMQALIEKPLIKKTINSFSDITPVSSGSGNTAIGYLQDNKFLRPRM